MKFVTAPNFFSLLFHFQLFALCLGYTTDRNFFFDFGANDGQSAEYFFGRVRKNHVLSLQGGDINSPLFSMGARGSWDAHLVEANPHFYDALTRVSQVLENHHPLSKITIYNGTAISTQDGEATFYLDDAIGHEGSSLVTTNKGQHPIKVRTISISKLFQTLEIKPTDVVVIKMDIEGAEFPVLIEIIAKGLLPYIDYLAIEWHDVNPYMGWSEEEKAKLSSQRRSIEMILNQSSTRVLHWA